MLKFNTDLIIQHLEDKYPGVTYLMDFLVHKESAIEELHDLHYTKDTMFNLGHGIVQDRLYVLEKTLSEVCNMLILEHYEDETITKIHKLLYILTYSHYRIPETLSIASAVVEKYYDYKDLIDNDITRKHNEMLRVATDDIPSVYATWIKEDFAESCRELIALDFYDMKQPTKYRSPYTNLVYLL